MTLLLPRVVDELWTEKESNPHPLIAGQEHFRCAISPLPPIPIPVLSCEGWRAPWEGSRISICEPLSRLARTSYR